MFNGIVEIFTFGWLKAYKGIDLYQLVWDLTMDFFHPQFDYGDLTVCISEISEIIIQ